VIIKQDSTLPRNTHPRHAAHNSFS